jgi:hypothetical protein
MGLLRDSEREPAPRTGKNALRARLPLDQQQIPSEYDSVRSAQLKANQMRHFGLNGFVYDA